VGFKAADLYEDFAAEGLDSMTTDGVHLNLQGHGVMAHALVRILADWLPSAEPANR
jgi:lysophospholipase L1-like esterase